MSRTTVTLSDSLEINSGSALCRICMKNNDSYYNIFTSNVACEMTVKDVLHDLVGLQVAMGDGLPTTICPLCSKKLMEFHDFKRICFESDAELRKLSSRNYIEIKEEKAADDNAESSADTKECVQDAIEGTSQFACSVQRTEIYIPVQDCQLPRANIMDNVKEEKDELLNEENYPAFNSPNTAGISSNAVDPLLVDDEPMFTEDEKLIDISKVNYDSMTETIGLSTPDEVLKETTSTSYLLAERNVWIDLKGDCIGSASVTHIQSETVASPCGDGMNVMGKDLKEGIAHHADKVLSNSSPDDGPSYMKHIPTSRNSENGATMNVFGGRGDAPNITDSLRFIRVDEGRRSGIEAVREDNEAISNCFIKSSRNGKNSNEMLYHCSYCRYGFNTIGDLIKHMEIHSCTSNLDLNDEASMGKDESFTVPASREESSNSCEPSTSETLIGLKRKRQRPMQKEKTSVVQISVGIGEEKTVEQMRSCGGDGEPNTQNKSSKSTSCARNLQNHTLGGTKGGPFNCSVCNKSFAVSSSLSSHLRSHKERKRYPCTTCSMSFATKAHLTQHMPKHTGEKSFSCNYCAKTFARKDKLNRHSHTHTGEESFSCHHCTKSFNRKENLILHSHVHTGEKPFSCNCCAKTFARKEILIQHLRVHTGEKSFSCNHCTKSFKRKANLIQHLHTHTD
ncbi:zinc finger protein 567-like [Ischnura elegans]|uniref:zinc finger protein 567-like n=1 Tax=Ischnura elegans TaxID=197161 RepID=UPI001ED8BCAF|nr:zinc finger protein 567-like [Ischnura elegans]